MSDYLTRKVLPALKDKHGEPLLTEFVRRSENHKIMIKCYQQCFGYLVSIIQYISIEFINTNILFLLYNYYFCFQLNDYIYSNILLFTTSITKKKLSFSCMLIFISIE